jgi:hypothetical protein
VLERKDNGMSIGQQITLNLEEEMTEDEACKIICGEKFTYVCGEECDFYNCRRLKELLNFFLSNQDLQQIQCCSL